MKIEVEIDDKILEKYEVVRIGNPKEGEKYLNYYNSPATQKASADHPSKDPPLIIVKEKYKWVGWIKSGSWIARNQTGSWYLFNKKPKLNKRYNYWVLDDRDENNHCIMLSNVFMGEFSKVLNLEPFIPPECDNWEESLRQKP